MAGSPQHATLVASTVLPVVFDQDYDRIEVLNVDGAAAVYFRIGATDPVIPTTAGTGIGTFVLPAAIGRIELAVTTSGPTQVRLLSSGTPKVSVRGVVDDR